MLDANSVSAAWDWVSKLGLGGLIGWFIRRWFEGRDSAVERGRQLVSVARPELVPMGAAITQSGAGTFQIRNRGSGIARSVRLELMGSAVGGRCPEIEPNTTERAVRVNFGDSQFFRRPLNEPVHLIVSYADRYGNDYQVWLPVRQESRADGGFNIQFGWQEYRHMDPRIAKRALRRIGS